MKTQLWQTKQFSVTSLHLDERNPRLGWERSGRSPREIIQHLFDHEKASDVAQSIADNGFFPNEPLLAVKENNRYVVVEGNRRLAALKALADPELLEGALRRRIDKLAQDMQPAVTGTVPVTIAPNRKATDQQLAVRHVGTPVRPWRAENRASFILEKIKEGYGNEELQENLGFTDAQIREARQTRSLTTMARSLDLPDSDQEKLDRPGPSSIISTLNRIFNADVAREALKVERDDQHGLRGMTTPAEFKRAFSRIVTDLLAGRETSRTLNANADIARYMRSIKEDLPTTPGSFLPEELTAGQRRTGGPSPQPQGARKRAKPESKAVLPRDFKVRHGSERIIEIRRELGKLKREDFPNASAVLLRVFFELSAIDYLTRTGELPTIVEKLTAKNVRIYHGVPMMRDLQKELTRIAHDRLPPAEARTVEKALRVDKSAPFSVGDLHSFVHGPADLPTERDIKQFWLRTEPFFKLMLEQDTDASK